MRTHSSFSGSDVRRSKAKFRPKARKRRQQMSLEALEDRVVLSYAFSYSGTTAMAIGSTGTDSLVISPIGGLLEYSVNGAAFSSSWGGPTVPAAIATTVDVTVESGNGASFQLGGNSGSHTGGAASLSSATFVLTVPSNTHDTAVIDDSASTNATTYAVDTAAPNYSITATGTGIAIHYTQPTGTFGGGITLKSSDASGDIVNVLSTVSGEPLNIANDGSATLNVGSSGGAGSMASIQGAISVSNSDSNLTALNFHDENDMTGQTWSLNNFDSISGTVAVTGSATTTYDPTHVASLTIDGGSGGNTFDVYDTSSRFPTTLNTGTGNDTTDVYATGNNTLDIYGQNGIDTVDLGGRTSSPKGMQGLSGTIYVANAMGLTNLVLDDSEDTHAQTALLFNDGNSGQVTGLSPATIDYSDGDGGVSSLTVYGGSGGNTFTVDGTLNNPGYIPALTQLFAGTGNNTTYVETTYVNGPLYVYGEGGQDSVYIGNAGSLVDILGPVFVSNSTGLTALTVDGSADPNSHDFTLSTNGLGTSILSNSTSPPASISYLATKLSSLTINTSDAGSQVLNIDMSGGNPIPSGGTPGLVWNAGADSTSGLGTHALHIYGTLPTGAFATETHDAEYFGTEYAPHNGVITFDDGQGLSTSLTSLVYTGLQPMTDTTPAADYTFNDYGYPDQSFSATSNSVTDPSGTFDTIEFTSTPTPPFPTNFETTDIANKASVVFNAPAAIPPLPGNGLIGTVNIPTASTGLTSLTFNTPTGGENDVSFLNTPPDVFTSFTGGAGPDVTNVTGLGVPYDTVLYLNGAAGTNTLNYDAGGEDPTVSPGLLPGEVLISIPGQGTVDAINYQQINITDVAPLVITPGPAVTINTVEGFQNVNTIVGTFTAAIPGLSGGGESEGDPPAGFPGKDFNASIDWGDPSPDADAGVITQDASNPSIYYITGTHTFLENGTYTVGNTVNFVGDSYTDSVNGTPVTVAFDAVGPVAGNSATANVVQATLSVSILPIVGTEGQPLSTGPIPVATFIDAGGVQPAADFSASITFISPLGANISVPGADISIAQNGNAAQYTVSANFSSLSLPEEGSYQVLVSVTDNGGATPITVQAAATATIADAPLSVTGTNDMITPTEGEPLPGLYLMTFRDANTAAPLSDFTAIIDWGDGSPTSIGTIAPGMTAGTFVVSGSHTYAEEGGPYAITVVVKDVGGSQTTAILPTFTVMDAPLSQPEGTPNPIYAVENQPLNNIAVGTFIDGNPGATAADFTVTIDWGDMSSSAGYVQLVGGSSAGALFAVFGSHRYTDAGTYDTTFSVYDKGGSMLLGATGAVANISDAPISVNVLPLTVGVGQSTSATQPIATFTDADGGDPVSNYTPIMIYWGDGSSEMVPSADVMPLGGGTFSIVGPTHTYAQSGVYALTVSVMDTDTAEGIGGNLVIVNSAVLTITPSSTHPIHATEGQPLTNYLLATFTSSDPTATAGNFLAVIDWGDGSPVTFGTVTKDGHGDFDVSGNHTYPEEGGPFTITVIVTDNTGAVAKTSLTAFVDDAPLFPNTAVPIYAVENQPLNDITVATFIDANPGATPADYTASINWGDGPHDVTPAFVQLVGGVAGGAEFAVFGSHVYTSAGTYDTTYSVFDDGGSHLINQTGGVATITDAPISVNVLPITVGVGESTSATQPIATFTDAAGVDPATSYTPIVIDWGDGSSETVPSADVMPLGGGTFSIVGPTHTYIQSGVYTVTVSVTDTDPATGIGGNVAIVTPAVLTLTAAPGAPIEAVEGEPLPPTEVATFTDNNPSAMPSDFLAVIDWGDGSPVTFGSVSAGPEGGFVVTGNHTYADEGGPFTITVIVTDNTGGRGVTTTTADVDDAPLSPNSATPIFAVENQPLNNIAIGTFLDANPGATAADFQVRIKWGDGSPVTPGFVQLVGGSSAGAIFAVYGSHIYPDAGTYDTSFSVLDKGGSMLMNAPGGVATISDAPISVNVLPLVATVGQPIGPQVIATFLDADGGDPVTNYTPITINWGDGTTDTLTGGMGVTPLGGGNFSITAPAHTYVKPGAYTLTVTVSDTDTATGIGGALVIVQPAVYTLTPYSMNITPTEGIPFSGELATFTDLNPAAMPSDFTVVIDWGDGSPFALGSVSPGLAPGTFVINGTHTYVDETPPGMPYTVTIFLTDNLGGTGTTTLTATVLDAPIAPLQGIDIYATENQPLYNVAVATFTDANPLATAADFTASISWGDSTTDITPAFVQLVGGTEDGQAVFAVYGSHVYTTAGTYQTQFTVYDNGGAAPIIAADGGVATISDAPISVNVLPLTVGVGQTLPSQVIATFTDADGGDPVTNYSPIVINWGDGLSDTLIGGAGVTALGGGTFSITAPAHTYTKPGVYALTVSVSDIDTAQGIGGNLVIVSPSVVTVTPVSTTPIAAVEGNPISVPLATFTDSDPSATAGSFLAVIDWGDGTPATLGSVTAGSSPGTFLVSGNHTYINEGGPYTVTVVVTDGSGGKGVATLSAVVTDAPLVNPTGIPVSGTAGHMISNAPLGVFSDTNPLATAADFTATINWGDPNAPGADPIGFVTLVGGTSTTALFSVSGSHLYSKAGTYTVAISVKDAGGQSTTITTTVTITASAISGATNPVVATEGLPTPASLPIATFSDPGAGPGTTFSVVVAWGDGTTNDNASGVTVVNNGGGNYTVLAPSHTYAEEGVYVITVTISGSDGSGPISPTNIATVKDAPLTASAGGPFTVAEGSLLATTNAMPLATFVDANPKGPLSDFTATIYWGDGTVTFGTVTQPGGVGTVFNVLGSHVYVNDGSYTATVLIVDVGGSRASVTVPITVTAATLTPGPQITIQAYENDPLTGVDVATFTSSSPYDTAGKFVATINWGDGTPVSAGVIYQDASGVFHVQGNHTYPNTGTYTVSVLIGTPDTTLLLSIPDAAVITVSSQPLVVSPVPITATEGIALPNAQNVANGTVVATYIDLGQADPLSSYTASIDWGNGQVTPGTIVVDGPNFAVLAPANPTILYPEAGTYTVKVTVTDEAATSPAGFFSAFTYSTATVKDAPLTAAPIQPVVSAFQQTPLVAVEVAEFTDGNPMAPLSDFTATIDWGDGSPQSAGSFIQPGGTGTAFYVTGNHTYANPTTPPSAPYTITVYIKDVDGSTLTTTTTASVQASTITGTPVTINGVEGQPIVNAVVAYFSDSATPGPLSSYSAMINWGTSLPGDTSIGQVVPLGGNNFEVVGSYTYPEENAAPNLPYAITVTIDHNGALATTVVSHANIADAPLIGVAVPVSAVEGAAFTGTVAFFTDTNPNGTVSDFTATIIWGDGTSSGGTVTASGAGFAVSAVDPTSGLGHVYKQAGTYTFSVTVKDVGGASFTAFATATVADAPLTATGVTLPAAGSPPIYEWPAFSGIVAYFTDANPYGQAPPVGTSDYVANINWGDGNTSIGTITQIATAPGAPTQFEVSGTNLYEEGTYSISVVIRDTNGGATAVAFSTITVTDSPLTPGPSEAITAVEGKSFTSQVATFTDADLRGVIANYVASIDWGDGSTSAGIIGQLANGTFTVTGTHTYAEDTTGPGLSPYAITVSIKDIGGASTTVDSTATVEDAKLTSQGTQIQGVEGISTGSVLVATFTDANPDSSLSDFTTGNGSVVVNWGDGSPLYTVPAANITSVGSPTGVTYQVYAAHIYAEKGTYQTTVTIKDNGGSATVANGQATIADAPLTTTGLVQPVVSTDEAVIYPIPEFGTPIFTGYVAEYNDTNPTGLVSDFKATIDWGDGSPQSAGTISQPGGVGTPFYVTGSHTYATSGVNGGVGHYPITVYVTDVDGSTLAVSNTANVTDNPLSVSGILNPSSNSGKVPDVTNHVQPNFYGTVWATVNGAQVRDPYANVTLYANGVAVGHTEAGSDGSWSITSDKLAQGTYTITAQATDQFGQTTSPVATLVQNLVIDTQGPVIQFLNFDRFDGTLTVVFDDNLSGMNLKSITNSAFYHISATPLAPNVHPPTLILPTSITYTPGALPSDPVVVHVVFNHGHNMRGGRYEVLINAGTGDNGIQDVAGNALDGNFYGTFPTGDGLPGGNFVAVIDTFHNVILPFIPKQDGYVPPAQGVDPPAGSSQTGKTHTGKTTPDNTKVHTKGKTLVHDHTKVHADGKTLVHDHTKVKTSAHDHTKVKTSAHDHTKVNTKVKTSVKQTVVHDEALLTVITETKPKQLAKIEKIVDNSPIGDYTELKKALSLVKKHKG